MAEELLPPFYRNIPELRPMLLYDINLTGKQLGVGSFGVVEELRYGGTICAGKKLHENLMDFRDEGVQQLIHKFVSECRLMSELRHPNIVQFLGLSFLKLHRHPILVMERLDINLDDLLEQDHEISLSSKFKVLLDVAKGLEYLHNRNPPVIHRDLTTRNVLLNHTTFHAKIGDLGNSLLVDQKKFTRTLSRNPGTTVYMPPEATGYAPSYDATLDMFSFGQLSLHTIIHQFPGDLLPATVCDPETEKITGISELERRKEYIDLLDAELDLDHPLNVFIRRCLSNLPNKRPQAREIIAAIENILSEKSDPSDEEGPSSDYNYTYASFEEVVDETMELIKNGEVRKLEVKVSCDDGDFIWKPCYFQLDLATNTLKYSYNIEMDHDIYEIHDITSLVTSESESMLDESKQDCYLFLIHYKGHGSPLLLRTASSDERSCWVELLSIHLRASESEPPIHLYGNVSYDLMGSVVESPSALSEEDKKAYSHPRPHYQPLDPSTRLPLITENFDLKDITLDNMPYIQQLATTNPGQFQIFLLVKMQKMLLEIQTERQSQAHQQVLPEASDTEVTEHGNTEQDHPEPSESVTSKSEDTSKGIVYSSLNFDYEVAKEEDMKLVLGNLLADTKEVTDKMLIIDDYSESYYPRPQWAKAETNSKADTDLDSLATMHQEALFLSESAVQDLEPIGEGQFGVVYKANFIKTTGRVPVAVKSIKQYEEPQEIRNFLKEQAVMAEMVHPNVVKLYGLIQRGALSPWIVLEYLPNGNLGQFLTRESKPVEKLVKYMLDIAVGMHYISAKGLIHRDLAARNIMVGKSEICKVGDFGLLREIPKDAKTYVSTSNCFFPVRWMAPESLEDKEFSPASDIWSFGVTLWEMASPGAKPYGERLSEIDCIVKIISGVKLDIPSRYPPTIQRIMKACWHKQATKRPSFLLVASILTNLTFGTDSEW